nr:hypothetical protein 4 [Pelagibacterales bacterium]
MDKDLYKGRQHLLDLARKNMPTGRREGYAARRPIYSFLSTDIEEAIKDQKIQELLGKQNVTADEVRKVLRGWDSRQTTLRSLMAGHSTHHLGSMSAEGGVFLENVSDEALYGFHQQMREKYGYSTGSEDAALRSQNDFAHTGKNPGGQPGASSVSSHRSNKNAKRAGAAKPTDTAKELFEKYDPIAQQNLIDYNFAQSTPPALADTAEINKVGKQLGISDDVVKNQGKLNLDQIKLIKSTLKKDGVVPANGGKWWNSLSPGQRKLLKTLKIGAGMTAVGALLDAGDVYAAGRDLTSGKKKTVYQKGRAITQGLTGATGLASLFVPALAPVAAGFGLGEGLKAGREALKPKPKPSRPNTYTHTPEKPVTVQEYKPVPKARPVGSRTLPPPPKVKPKPQPRQPSGIESLQTGLQQAANWFQQLVTPK